MIRPSWTDFFMSVAFEASLRSTCKRAQVGAVIVRDKHIISTGYAGSASGQPHCLDENCVIGKSGGCERTIHAELNALLQAAKLGISTNGCEMYCTLSPCMVCLRACKQAGVYLIIYQQEYRIFEPVEKEAKLLGMRLIPITEMS